ncbi:ribosome recycling factor [Sulfurimonas gotlandica GD1]|uniref:Ribosome-recycling factor n=1 Tax=Sulfurimonas gotlandica (strain DSM 19862 / JCM 16533 / GD1) TaxID=929558 RepID=B6BGV8_SULGG|nr:ribosome recycling factor [Sulfurimonas gotlandica]EDZ63609.1 ribosome recycling factor [Sulfurimonas gotlandica GD1]EHP29742.1 ribosome recycling factor [Sulfurimonas gotlandica GD1]
MLNEIYDACEKKMKSSIEHMQRDFKTLRTGKITTSVLDNVRIDYYGTMTSLDQVGSIIATDATTIVVNPWEKNLLPAIESAISKANVGANPNNDGDQIKLFFPAMTVEQRKESVKQMKGMGENAKVSLRNDRKNANDQIKKLEKDKEITADESKSAQDNIQKITDKFSANTEQILKDKEAEILKV